MFWFICLFISIVTSFVYSLVRIIKKREVSVLSICSIINVILFLIIFVSA